MVAAATFTILAYYAITNVAALRMPAARKLYPDWIAACGLAGCVLLALSQRPATLAGGSALLAAGFVVRALTADHFRARRPPHAKEGHGL